MPKPVTSPFPSEDAGFSHCLRRGMKDMKDSEGSQWITDVDDVHLYIESTSYRCITLPSGNLT